MSNSSQWVLVKRFAEVTGYSENAIHHKVKNGTWAGNSVKVPDVRESSERDQQGGAG
jgi:hypothetical protein